MLDRLTARIASRWLSYGLPFLYFLTSIAFYLRTYDSAQVKITIVQMLGTTLIGLWYVVILSDRERDWKAYWPLAVPLLASLVSGLLSWTHAAYPGPSIDEMLRRVFYIHFGLIALTELKTQTRMRRMMLFLLGATAVASGYGLLQFLDWKFYTLPIAPGVDPFVWRQAFGSRMFSTFGNPNFFGNFLVIVTPITLSFLIRRHSERPGSVLLFVFSTLVVSAMLWHAEDVVRLLHMSSWMDPFVILTLGGYLLFSGIRFGWLGILFFLITFCNTITVSKGAWVGYAAAITSFMVLVLFYFSQFQSEDVRRLLKRVAIGMLFVATLGVGIYSMQRVDSLRFRIVTWVSTWEMTQMHPIWGNGIGCFRVIYPAFRRPQIFHIEGKHNTETDHAENEYWEVLMDEGIIGFGIFLWVIITFSMMGLRALGRFTEGLSIRDPTSGRRKISEDPRAYYMLGLLAAFWGMLIHNMMDVSLRFVSSGIFLWLLVGMIGALVMHDPLPSGEPSEKELKNNANLPDVNPAPAFLTVPAYFLTAGCLGWITFEILTQFADAQGPMAGQFGEQLLWLIAWIAVLFTIGMALYAIYQTCQAMRQPLGMLVLLAVYVYPLHEFWGYFMADVFHNRGIYFSKSGQWEPAVESYRKVVSLNPNYMMAYYFMGNVYTDRWGPGDVDRAMKEYERVWSIAPNYVQSHHQAGLVFLKKGQDDFSRFKQLNDAHRLPEAQQAFNEARADWQKAIHFFEKYHMIDPVFEGNYTRKAWVHMQLSEMAAMERNTAEAEHQRDLAEACYRESLQAWICRAPENDVMHENWERTHRHYDRPYAGEMWSGLGNVRFIRGRVADAVRAYKMSLRAAPDNVAVMKNLANAYARLGRQGDVVATWEAIRRLSPQDPDVLRIFHGSAIPSHP